MTVGVIWAQAANGVVGCDGVLPWHLPEDLLLFRELTMGSTVVMGRVTWESLPDRFRPLPGRRNVVLTRQEGWSAPGADVAPSVDAAIRRYGEGTDRLWFIGGGAVYKTAIEFADEITVTRLQESFDGDTYAPSLGPEWSELRRQPAEGWSVSRTGLHYCVSTLQRTPSVAVDAVDPSPGVQSGSV